jgi:L-fucose isomerase-like protein
MADPAYSPVATVHSNRRLPLLSEFPLKPGRVTLARFSRSRGVHRLVIGGGEMLSAPPSFSGTSGVLQFDRTVDDVLATVMDEGLEHHYGVVYGDVREPLGALAALLSLPTVEL